MIFNEILRKLRKEINLTQKEMADRIDIERSTYTQYETGRRNPSIETVSKMADLFDCSVDYLLGKTDIRKPIEIIVKDAGVDYNPDNSLSKENMPRVLKQLGVAYIQLAEDIQAEDISPDDVRELIDIIKKHKKSSD